MQSMGRADLIVMMPLDDRLVRDLLMYKRTEKYIQQNISITQQDAVKRILTDRSFQNRERYVELQKTQNSSEHCAIPMATPTSFWNLRLTSLPRKYGN